MTYFSAHTHSHHSQLDGMTAVKDLVGKAALLGQPAMALTDHGNMAGSVRLYKEATKHGMKPYPGVEAYLLDPTWTEPLETAAKAKRYHLGLLALNQDGYKSLVRLVSMTHTRPRFSRFPRLTLPDLAQYGQEHGQNVALTTGCYFGYLQQVYLSEGPVAATRWLKTLTKWFPHLFVEVQHHNICHDPVTNEGAKTFTDDQMVASLIGLADDLGLPVIATQDSHYTDQRQKHAHALMKRMVYGSHDDAFPGDSFHLASGEWVQEHYEPRQWDRVTEGLQELYDLNSLSIPHLDKFVAHVPVMTKNPDLALVNACQHQLAELGLENSSEYQDRVTYELQVIKELGMADYFLYMLECIEWCRKRDIVVEARGSANGSLVCYLLNITQVDPIQYGTVFDRFLSRDRIKPPDIDMDIESVHRQALLEYLSQNYDTIQIGNWGELGLREEDGRGSVLQTYLTHLRTKCEAEAMLIEERRAERQGRKAVKGNAIAHGRALFHQQYSHIESIEDVYQIDEDDYRHLREMADHAHVYKSYGVHASGVLVSGKDMDISDWVPSMLVASSNTCVVGETTLSLVGRKPTRTVEQVYRILHGKYGDGPDIECFGCGVTLPPLKQPRHSNHKDARLCQACKNIKSRVTKRGLTVEGRSVDGTIKPERLKDVIYTGFKPVYRVLLASGHEITATEDHRHLTDIGWRYVRDLSRGDRVAVRGNAAAMRRKNRVLAGKGNNFSRRLVLDVATRAQRVCEHCGIPEPENGTHDLAHKAYDNPQSADQFLYLCRRCHLEFDRNSRRSRYAVGIPIDYSEIVSIRAAGNRHVYDVCMDSEDHSWVANGIVTHNCVTQFDMDDVEEWGMLKSDWLGQQSLSVMRRTQELAGIDDPTDFRWIPEDDANACRLLRSGRTDNGIFHAEGHAKAKGFKELSVRSTADVILGTALYMPGAVESGMKDHYLYYRRNSKERKAIKYLHTAFEKALSETHGAVIYQEQPLMILRELGMSIERINVMFKIVKDSGKGAIERNEERLASLKEEFVSLCTTHGIAEHEEAWHQITGFISYAFNKNHATGYGIRTYRMAYLKAHYPLEYMTALLEVWGGTKKETLYVREARSMGIKILSPDVNISGASWTIDRQHNAIRRGLLSIKGVGLTSAELVHANAPYADMQDLATKCSSMSGSKKYLTTGSLSGVLSKLDEGNALTSLKGAS